jgi:hypothetical protein
VEKYINHLEGLIDSDYAAEYEFKGGYNKWLKDQITKDNKSIRLIPGTDVGTKTINEEPVLIDDLLNQEYIPFFNKMYGIWIPAEQILKRNSYEWFARLSAEQIFQSNTILAKHFVSTIGLEKERETETENNKENDWISFWRVPATNGTLNVYGLMPSGLGDNVPRSLSTGLSV